MPKTYFAVAALASPGIGGTVDLVNLMPSQYTAIIHLRDSQVIRNARTLFEPMLRVVRGIERVQFDRSESLLTVDFDSDQTSLAEIVRVVEDCGTPVAGVAQRRMLLRQAG